jgi:hypothetical protein
MKFKIKTTMLAGALALGLAGCAQLTRNPDPSHAGPFHTVGNVYQPDGLPANLQRVVVLPLVPGRGNRMTERGVPLIKQTFIDEFSRARIFDVVTLSPGHLEQLVGVRALHADSPLPKNFLETIQKGTVCEAVLFAELTTYRAYPPVAIGWKLHLFDLKTEKLLWAVDEVFDTGRAPVANALRRHMRQNLSPNNVAPTEIIVLDSPRELARYSLGALIATFEQNNPKVTSNPAEDTIRQSGSGTPGSETNEPDPVEGSEKPGPTEAEPPEKQEIPVPPLPRSDAL